MEQPHFEPPLQWLRLDRLQSLNGLLENGAPHTLVGERFVENPSKTFHRFFGYCGDSLFRYIKEHVPANFPPDQGETSGFCRLESHSTSP